MLSLPNVARTHAADAVAAEKGVIANKSLPTWKYSLNMSTIRGQKLPLDQQITVAAKAGYKRDRTVDR